MEIGRKKSSISPGLDARKSHELDTLVSNVSLEEYGPRFTEKHANAMNQIMEVRNWKNSCLLDIPSSIQFNHCRSTSIPTPFPLPSHHSASRNVQPNESLHRASTSDAIPKIIQRKTHPAILTDTETPTWPSNDASWCCLTYHADGAS
jgi:hypothetical protein